MAEDKRDLILTAYELLSDGDKVLVDLQVKHIMDYYEMRNAEQRARKLAIFPLSRDGALEIVYSLGRFLNNPKIAS